PKIKNQDDIKLKYFPNPTYVNANSPPDTGNFAVNAPYPTAIININNPPRIIPRTAPNVPEDFNQSPGNINAPHPIEDPKAIAQTNLFDIVLSNDSRFIFGLSI